MPDSPDQKLTTQRRPAVPAQKKRPGRRRMRPRTRARITFGIFAVILLTTLFILLATLFRRRPDLLPNRDSSSNLLVEGGEAQLLESFTKPALLPERVSTVRLDGVMILQSGENYATFTVDGITATMVQDDYVGDYQIAEITASGVELEAGDETVVLTLQDNKLDTAGREEEES